MTTIEDLEKKMDNMLAREDVFEERHKKGVIGDVWREKYNHMVGYLFLLAVIMLLVGMGVGYFAGHEAAIREITNNAIQLKLGVVI